MSAFQALAWSRPCDEITRPGPSGPKPPQSPRAGGGPRSPPGHLLSSVPLPRTLSSGNMASRCRVASKSLSIVLQSQSVKSNCSVVISFPLSCLRLRKRAQQHSSSRAGKTQASSRRRPGRGPVCPCRAGFLLQGCPSAVLKFQDPIHVYPVHTDSHSGVPKPRGPCSGPAPGWGQRTPLGTVLPRAVRSAHSWSLRNNPLTPDALRNAVEEESDCLSPFWETAKRTGSRDEQVFVQLRSCQFYSQQLNGGSNPSVRGQVSV